MDTACYLNHLSSFRGPLYGNTIWIVAIKDIRAGEELTYNYGCDDEEYESNPCNCGANNCYGYILHPRYWQQIKVK